MDASNMEKRENAGDAKTSDTSRNDFCHQDNFAAALAYLSQELTLAGLPAVVGPAHSDLNPVALVNAAWHLLCNGRRAQSLQAELQQRLALAVADKQLTEVSLGRCRDQLAVLEGRCGQQQEQYRQQAARLSSCHARLADAKEEARRQVAIGQHKSAQFQHDLKKQERQMERLKDMVHRLLDKQSQERRSGIVISSLLSRPDGSRARWRTPATAVRCREQAYERVLAGSEARHLRSVQETQRLRTCLVGLLRALTEATAQIPCEDCTTCDDADFLTNVEVGLPFDLVSEKLESMVSCQLEKVARLTGRTNDLTSNEAGSPAAADGEQAGDELRRRLEAAERMVLEQRQLIEGISGEQGDCDGSFQQNAYFVEEREELAMRERMLEEQRQALDREREIYTEAVLRLGRERVAFEEEKAELVRAQFLASSPLLSGRPSSARSSPSDVTRLRVTSPARRAGRRSPASPDRVSAVLDLPSRLGRPGQGPRNPTRDGRDTPEVKPVSRLSC